MVFITVQNLVGIDAIVLIICMFSILPPVWLENAYSRPQNWGFGGFDPLNEELSNSLDMTWKLAETFEFENVLFTEIKKN